jgi:hypothetical protein
LPAVPEVRRDVGADGGVRPQGDDRVHIYVLVEAGCDAECPAQPAAMLTSTLSR